VLEIDLKHTSHTPQHIFKKVYFASNSMRNNRCACGVLEVGFKRTSTYFLKYVYFIKINEKIKFVLEVCLRHA